MLMAIQHTGQAMGTRPSFSGKVACVLGPVPTLQVQCRRDNHMLQTEKLYQTKDSGQPPAELARSTTGDHFSMQWMLTRQACKVDMQETGSAG